MNSLLTEAEREAVESAWLYPGHGHSAAENPVRAEELITTLAAVITRLLSARAVQIPLTRYEMFQDWVGSDDDNCSIFEIEHRESKTGCWVKFSAAEAYTAGMRDALQEILECGSIREAERIAARALTDTTTKEEA